MEQPENTFDITNLPEFTFQGKVGSTVSIKVVGNITTGYNWFINKESYDSSSVLCTNLSEYGTGKYIKKDSDSDSSEMECGRPGYLLFDFELKKQGNYDLELIYKRAWETSSADSKKIHFNIQ